MLLAQLFVRDPKHRLGGRKQDVPLIKAHPFFGALLWEQLHAKQLTSPLRAPIEAVLASRAVGGHRPKRALLNSADQDIAPSLTLTLTTLTLTLHVHPNKAVSFKDFDRLGLGLGLGWLGLSRAIARGTSEPRPPPPRVKVRVVHVRTLGWLR